MSTANAPSPRANHSAVWADSRMIVWGGIQPSGLFLNTGSRYDPVSDTWTPMSTTNAPDNRYRNAAVWTGSSMIVWGGYNYSFNSSGGRYDPITDTWSPTSLTNAPERRYEATAAVWTGETMIVWGGWGPGGSYLQTGGRYNPATDTWLPTSTVNAPVARGSHEAVWTGSRMIIWGGSSGSGSESNLATGALYDPVADTWTPTTTVNAPSGRYSPKAVWTGTHMIVWGGASGTTVFDTGGRYDPASDSWTPTGKTPGPSGLSNHSAVWTGTQMIVWGGQAAYQFSANRGWRYKPATDDWSPTTSVGAPPVPFRHTAVWTGSRMIVWGGLTNTGGRYDPIADSWTPTTTTGAPQSRTLHTAVWTGTRMIVWGGQANAGEGPAFSTGGLYDPITDTWTPTSGTNAPEARAVHTAVWTGAQMIVWGGYHYVPNPFPDPPSAIDIATGARYDPATDTWAAVSTANAPEARHDNTAVWTGSHMLVWGGRTPGFPTSSGGRYDPAANTWTPMATGTTPRQRHTAVWTGTRMIVWGGEANEGNLRLSYSGARYDPATNSWEGTSTLGVPAARFEHSAVWTGSFMIVWGGRSGDYPFSSGGRYGLGLSSDDDGDGLSECAGDCNDSDPTLEHAPSEVGAVMLEGSGPTNLHFQSQDPAAGSSTAYDVVTGSLQDLRGSGTYGGALCLGTFPDAPAIDPGPSPAPGAGSYYLIRAINACGTGTFGESGLSPDPRDELDTNGPCP